MKSLEVYKKVLPDFVSEYETKNEFNKQIRSFFKCNYALGVANGTIAVEVALRALDIPLGSSVIVPEISFIATATAVANCGYIPVYADVDASFYGLSYESLVKSYTPDVRCVIVVHFAGFVNRDIYKIKQFCEEKQIYLIEDCAQAFGAKIDDAYVGTIGDIGTFSFQSSKIVNAGEGGLVITNSKKLFHAGEMTIDWGINSNDDTRLSFASSNFRLSAIQCYLIIKQLECFDDIFKERLRLVDEMKAMAEEKGIKNAFPEKVSTIVDCPFFFPVFSREKYNTIEPRAEYPMSNSQMVPAILTRFYPQLSEKYTACNTHTNLNACAKEVLETIDFINFYDVYFSSITEILASYTTH